MPHCTQTPFQDGFRIPLLLLFYRAERAIKVAAGGGGGDAERRVRVQIEADDGKLGARAGRNNNIRKQS